MVRRSSPALALCAAVLLHAALPARAAAEPKWVITEFAAHGVDADTVATFRNLVRDELQTRNGATFADIPVVCEDAGCALGAATGTGADVVVYGSVGKLGGKLSVSVRTSALATSKTLAAQSLTVDRPEELDIAAKRLATAIVNGERASENAELGTITHEEAKVPTRRDTRLGVLLGLQGIAPLSGYADELLGGGIMLGAFVETYDFVIEPALGCRFDMSRSSDAWVHIPIELSLAYLFSRSDVAPFLGGGVGLHLLFERVHVQRAVGSVLRSTSKDVITDTLGGVSVYPRAGILFLRTYTVSLELAVDLPVTFADFEERATETALRFGINLVIGGA